jgi:hypothetical protein
MALTRTTNGSAATAGAAGASRARQRECTGALPLALRTLRPPERLRANPAFVGSATRARVSARRLDGVTRSAGGVSRSSRHGVSRRSRGDERAGSSGRAGRGVRRRGVVELPAVAAAARAPGVCGRWGRGAAAPLGARPARWEDELSSCTSPTAMPRWLGLIIDADRHCRQIAAPTSQAAHGRVETPLRRSQSVSGSGLPSTASPPTRGCRRRRSPECRNP